MKRIVNLQKIHWFQGFSLIELMVTMAIIGILSSIAIPAYRTYIIKAHMANMISFGTAQTTAVAEYIAETGVGPTTAGTAGVVPKASCKNIPISGATISTLDTADVASWTVADGVGGNAGSGGCVIGVTSGSNMILGTTITLYVAPSFTTDGSLIWTCKSGAGNTYAPACP